MFTNRSPLGVFWTKIRWTVLHSGQMKFREIPTNWFPDIYSLIQPAASIKICTKLSTKFNHSMYEKNLRQKIWNALMVQLDFAIHGHLTSHIEYIMSFAFKSKFWISTITLTQWRKQKEWLLRFFIRILFIRIARLKIGQNLRIS